jgi:NAD(P)-dependent dehydrogenase (short-subunit alcohol dehydrogenase family)
MSENALPLTGKVLLLTGGSRNLGEAVARHFARLGAAVAVNHYLDGEKAGELVSSLRGEGHQAVVFEANVGVRAEVERLVRQAVGALGPVDILIHCAGPFAMTPFAGMGEAEWDGILNVNLKAGYMLAGLVAPGMRQKGWGRIILMSAGSAFIRAHSIYTLSKAAVITLTEELAVELGPEITVNAIAPGQIEESAAIMDGYEPGFSARATAAAPLKQLCRRGQVAEMMGLICTSPAMEIVTGHTFVMDGGWRLTA